MPLSCNKTKWIGRMPPTEEVFTRVTYSLFMRTKGGGLGYSPFALSPTLCPSLSSVSQKLTPSLMDYASQNPLCSDFLLESSNGRQWPEVRG